MSDLRKSMDADWTRLDNLYRQRAELARAIKSAATVYGDSMKAWRGELRQRGENVPPVDPPGARWLPRRHG